MSFKRFISVHAPPFQHFLLNNPRVASHSHNIDDLLKLSKHIELRAIDATPNLQHVFNFLKLQESKIQLCPKKHWHFFNSVGIHCLHVIPPDISEDRLFIDVDEFAKDIEDCNNNSSQERKIMYFVVLYFLYLLYIFLAANI